MAREEKNYELSKRITDVCCLQEVRWCGQDGGDEWKEI